MGYSIGKELDSGSEHLQHLDDPTKLSDAVDTLEGRNGILRDLDRLEDWACVNSKKYLKAKLGQDN